MDRSLNWTGLVVETLRNPAAVAETLMALNLSRQVLYTAVLLVAALNALLAGVAQYIAPSPMPLPPMLSNPMSLFVLIAGGLVISAHLFYWAGRAMGGAAQLPDLLVLFVWLQFLRALAQVIILVTGALIPLFGALLALAAMLVGLWLFVHFVNAAHRFNSLGRAIGLMIVVFAGLVLGLTLLITLIGATNVGLTANV